MGGNVESLNSAQWMRSIWIEGWASSKNHQFHSKTSKNHHWVFGEKPQLKNWQLFELFNLFENSGYIYQKPGISFI
jgi:hypothetical protein